MREVQSAPEGIVVISSDIQIKDVARFCTLPPRGVAEVFSGDLTFKLGDFYVTVTSFRNPMLISKEGTHPTHIGPVQIQHRKLLSSYKYFSSSLKRIEPSIIDLKTFVTDEESNIVDAFTQEFPSAVNIQCFRHFKKAIERKLKNWIGSDRNQVCFVLKLK